MESHTISVIVPVYNMEKTLRRALDSIVAQTYKDFEVIMVDDGSKDGSGEICDEYASRYDNFRVVHKKNGGPSSARNAGIAESKTQWVTFCDSDDFVFPDWLANFRLDEGRDCDMLTQGMKADIPTFGRGQLHKESGFDFEGNPKDFLCLADQYTILGYTVIKAYRTTIIQDNGLKFDERLWYREDEVFLLEYLSHCKKIKSYEEAGYFYFAPNFSKKYQTSIGHNLLFEESIFSALCRINPSTYDLPFALITRTTINRILTEEFYKTKDLNCIRKLHSYFKSYPDFAQLSFLTRKAIQIDPTCLISGFILYLHMGLRKMLGMGGAKDRIFGRSHSKK